MNAKPARRRRPADIVIRSPEGTLVGELKTIKDKVAAEQAIAQLLKCGRRTARRDSDRP